jgi:biotin-dependent carboxylase-like uncharacterized protein
VIGLRVEACGPGTTVQDTGRTGWRRFGVATAGAMDRDALALANTLVGNPPAAAAVELALAGARFRVEGAALLLAVAGPGVALAIDGRAVAPGTSARAEPGSAVSVGPVRGGVYACLAVGGGFALAPQMGSLSMHRRSGVGGRALVPGDRLPCHGGATVPRRLMRPLPPQAGPIRVMAGPQRDHFTDAAWATLLSAAFRIDARSDRMGCRLDGPVLAHAAGYNIVSDGVVPGSIQVPGDGRPIVLMRDAQTTGGYPKIAAVIGADLDRLAQTPPGAAVRFAAVDRAAAVAAWRDRLAARAALATAVVALPAEPMSAAALLGANLIDGVIDARAP